VTCRAHCKPRSRAAANHAAPSADRL